MYLTIKLRRVAWAIVAGLALLAAYASPAAADPHGIVVTCATVDVWDHAGLGVVTVTRPGSSTVYEPGNALRVPYRTDAGPVTGVATTGGVAAVYVITAPAGCPTSTTSTAPATTTPSTTPPPTVTAPPVTAPPATSTTTSSAPPATAAPPPDPPTLPPAPPANPVPAEPRFTG